MNNSILIFIIGLVVGGALVGGYFTMNAAPAPESATENQEEAEGAEEATGSTSGGTTVTPAGATAPQKVYENGQYVYIVNFNNDTFSPAVITIKKGEAVRFVNKDNLSMRVSATLEATNGQTISDPKSVPKGGSFTTTFNTAGKWVVKNLNDTTNPGGGVVNVQ